MKKQIKYFLFLSALMSVLLSGCTEDVTDYVPEQSDQREETEMPEEQPEDADVLQEKTEASVNIYTNVKKKTYYLENGEPYFYLTYCDVSAEGEGCENLKRSIEQWSLERSEQFRNIDPSLEEQAKKEVNFLNGYGYTRYQNVVSKRIDNRAVSLLETCNDSSIEGGSYEVQGINFDTQSGKRLAFSDVLTDQEKFLTEVKAQGVKKLKDLYGEVLPEDYEVRMQELWNGEEPVWYMDAEGIVVLLDPSELGIQEADLQKVHMPYAEYGHYIKQTYLPGSGDRVAAFSENQELFLKLPQKDEAISLKLIEEPEREMMTYTLQLGNAKTKLAEYVSLVSAYLMEKEGEIYCLVEVDMASDDYVTYIFRLTEGKLEKIAEGAAAIDEGNINTESIKMDETIYCLGTYGGTKIYYFNDEGAFVTDDTEYLLSKNDYVLTTTADIPVILEENENILPAGSHILLNATDDETYVTFTIQETGQQGRMEIGRAEDQYYLTINGMSEYDCFENLPYAG